MTPSLLPDGALSVSLLSLKRYRTESCVITCQTGGVLRRPGGVQALNWRRIRRAESAMPWSPVVPSPPLPEHGFPDEILP